MLGFDSRESCDVMLRLSLSCDLHDRSARRCPLSLRSGGHLHLCGESRPYRGSRVRGMTIPPFSVHRFTTPSTGRCG